MNNTISQILDVTLIAVVLYLILSQAQGFSTVATSSATAYATSVRALQGR